MIDPRRDVLGALSTRLGTAIVALATVAVVGAGCAGGGDAAKSEKHSIDVVAFGAMGPTYRRGLEPAFVKHSPEGPVHFVDSLGPSEAQGKAVARGDTASVVHLERILDMERLVEAGAVAPEWDEQPYNGIADKSVIVFVVRKGNPKQIHNIRNLLRGDVEVVLPDPLHTACGQWSVMDVYATRIHERRSKSEALAAVRTVLEKTILQPQSPAAAMAAFLGGEGDVLITYESEAIQAVEAGRGGHMQFVVPHQTMLVEDPIALTKDGSDPQAEAFLKFIWSTEGQEILAAHGFRPANPRLVDQERFFPRHNAFRIRRFGGWPRVESRFFDRETGPVARIERRLQRRSGRASPAL